MKMNKWVTPALLLTGIACATLSCSKYEDGPKFSLLTKKMRLTRSWDAKELVYDGGASVVDSSNDLLTFENNGDAHYSIGAFSVYGSWDFSDEKDLIRVTYGGTTDELKILRLTKKELWLRTNNESYYIRYEAK